MRSATYSIPYLRSSNWHTIPNINSTILTAPVGVERNPSEMHVQHRQIPHREQPGPSEWVGVRVINPPDGEAMYTCLTSGAAFFPNILVPSFCEMVNFGFKCIWLNEEEPGSGLKLEMIICKLNYRATDHEFSLIFNQLHITHIFVSLGAWLAFLQIS